MFPAAGTIRGIQARAGSADDPRRRVTLGVMLPFRWVLFLFLTHFAIAEGELPKPSAHSETQAVQPATVAESWWAFRAIENPPLPEVRKTEWIQSPIDRFILAKLESRNLQPAPRATPEVLLRRAAIYLTGLPPSPAELQDFLRDSTPAGFAREVERLLASPRYGERWGQHWMDVARYADTAGDNADYPVPEARLYRDYIIDSFNQDRPFDQFIREQLAGDILAASGPRELHAERVIATGFLALSRRYATAPFEFMHLTIEDAIETTGRAFLGMTFRCARCHDHKYDPVSKEDYYGLYGFFASTRFPYAGSEEFASKDFPRSGFVPLVPEADLAGAIADNRQHIERLRPEIARLKKDLEEARTNAVWKAELERTLKPLQLELKRRDRFGAPPGVAVAYAVTEDKPTDQFIQVRGEPADPGPIVPRRAPCSLGISGELTIPAGASGRLQLAEWIASPANPLTARVMVNRIWQHHFGKGLVHSASNFGRRGDPPTHPELLDYLARYFITHGWSVKSIQRLLVDSSTWQQASLVAPETGLESAPPALDADSAQALARDPANDLYSRFERQRLDAETIRDAAMSVAGTLRLDRPGPHPFPKFEDWAWTQHNHFKADYESSHRSVYLMRQRLQRHPYLALFDAPDANISTDVRNHSTVPLQALYLMNHSFIRQQAEALARRTLAGAADDEARIAAAYLLAWSRQPTPSEINRWRNYLRKYATEFTANAPSADSATADLAAWSSFARVLLTANEFFYVD